MPSKSNSVPPDEVCHKYLCSLSGKQTCFHTFVSMCFYFCEKLVNIFVFCFVFMLVDVTFTFFSLSPIPLWTCTRKSLTVMENTFCATVLLLVNQFTFWKLFSCGTPRVVPSGQDSSILPALVANHSAGIGSSCLLTELAI